MYVCARLHVSPLMKWPNPLPSNAFQSARRVSRTLCCPHVNPLKHNLTIINHYQPTSASIEAMAITTKLGISVTHYLPPPWMLGPLG